MPSINQFGQFSRSTWVAKKYITGKCASCTKRKGTQRAIHYHPGKPILCDVCYRLRLERIKLNRFSSGEVYAIDPNPELKVKRESNSLFERSPND